MSLPKIGQVIYMYAEHGQSGEINEYKTRLVDENDHELLFDFPVNVSKNESSYIGISKKVRVEYIRSGVPYFFESTILRHINRNVHLMVIPKPELTELQQIQRRNFFRIEIDVDLAVEKTDLTKKIFRTDDIGGGGISFIAGPSDVFEKGETLQCWIVLPHKNGSIEHANFNAEIVRVKEEENGHKIIMLRYLDIPEIERQRIIRFSFAKQIELKDKSIT